MHRPVVRGFVESAPSAHDQLVADGRGAGRGVDVIDT
jgi:hypothetical protein